ncbi:MAG TPA: hypothetical protein VFV23_02765 [Verrucomicrobiae bacterium]|nr:hypothetical protein [Verrucomicrobiae bacterium]
MKISLFVLAATLASGWMPANGQGNLTMHEQIRMGDTPPIPVSLEGFSGEVESVLRFDLYVQGFSFVSPDAAQYQITGSNNGNVEGRVTDKVSKKVILARSYTGASLRREAHALSDEIVLAITGKKGIAELNGSTARIAFKKQPGGYGPGEIYVSEFDGYGAQAVTHDNAICSAPSWVPGKLALFYNSYFRNNPDIYYHDLTTGQRKTVARYGGSNMSPAASPDGTKVAMILSKDGAPNVYVANADGSNLKRLTHGEEDSSPCWSPDGQWICFATKVNERRRLAKVSVNGGEVKYLNTIGTVNPTEPDWSPDGKWIAYTRQAGEFDICVTPADGGSNPVVLVRGEDPSWAPNSRTLVYCRRSGGRYVLSVLDVLTKQFKDVQRISGSDSEPSWAK